MNYKLFVVFIATLLICGLFFQAEAGKKKLLKKGLKAALIVSFYFSVKEKYYLLIYF